jgi:hypothetical protein
MLEIGLGDVVRLKKRHPCGGFHWVVERLGADIGLVCQKCGRRVLMDRLVVERRVREIVRAGEKGGEAKP